MAIVLWDVTSRCNLRCAHCAAAARYPNNQLTDEVTLEQARIILNHLGEIDCQQLRLVGGEPLLRRDIVDLVALAHQLGFPRVIIYTNGIPLTPQLADDLLDAGLDDFVVSLEGATAPVHEQVRGPGVYAKAIRALEIMLERRPPDSKLKVATLFTLSRINSHQAAAIVNLAGQMGLDRLTINKLETSGNAQKNAQRLSIPLVETLDAREAVLEAAARYPNLELEIFGKPRTIEYFNERFGRALPIFVPSCELVSGDLLGIEADGMLRACEEIQTKDATILREDFRLQTQPLSAILSSSYFAPLRQLVNQALDEGWQDHFVPCARCHFRPACQICPLVLQRRADQISYECLLSIRRLAQWRKSQSLDPVHLLDSQPAAVGRHQV